MVDRPTAEGTITSTTRQELGADGNEEAIRAWDGPLFDRFLRFREILTTGLAGHGDAALALVHPRAGDRVLDVGCGFGETTLQIAEIVGPGGAVVGVDAASRFLEVAVNDAAEAGVGNARFMVADVQTDDLGGPYDLAFSRFGMMFFGTPVAALRNVRAALVPGGRLVMVVWRRRTDNPWSYRAQTIVEGIVSRPEEYDEPTCGPGPFSMADADTTSQILLLAGFTDVSLTRCDLPITIGGDVEQAIDLVMSLGPAGEILRLSGDRAADLLEPVRQALREGFAEFTGPEGISAMASTWIVSATAPAGGSD